MLRKRFRLMTFMVLLLLGVWTLAVQAGCFSMRTPDRAWAGKLQKQGQYLAPQFLEVPDAAGRRIHAVYVHTADTLPWVILVHGSPGSADAFLEYLADTALTQRVHLVAMDRPGFGYTEGFGKPEPSIDAQANAILALVDHLAPKQKVVLVGHSLGGPVIARFAMLHPERTAGLLLVSASVDPKQEEHPWWQQAINKPPLQWVTPKSFWTSNAEIIPLEKELEKMIPFWKEITCPVYLLHATNDRLVPVANAIFAREMLVNSPELRVEILPKGDHFFLWTQPQLVKKAILELSKVRQ